MEALAIFGAVVILLLCVIAFFISVGWLDISLKNTKKNKVYFSTEEEDKK